jgi:hypothetical protein
VATSGAQPPAAATSSKRARSRPVHAQGAKGAQARTPCTCAHCKSAMCRHVYAAHLEGVDDVHWAAMACCHDRRAMHSSLDQCQPKRLLQRDVDKHALGLLRKQVDVADVCLHVARTQLATAPRPLSASTHAYHACCTRANARRTACGAEAHRTATGCWGCGMAVCKESRVCNQCCARATCREGCAQGRPRGCRGEWGLCRRARARKAQGAQGARGACVMCMH